MICVKLALDLPAMWRHGAAPFDLKKRIVRAVIKEIVVYVEAATLLVSCIGRAATIPRSISATQSRRASLEDCREHSRAH